MTAPWDGVSLTLNIMSAVLRPAQILLVGQKIRQIRKSRHLTQADLASRIGVTQSDLSRMENGEYKVGLDALFKILQVFELPMSRFFDEPASDGAAEAAGPREEFAAGDEAKERLLADWADLSDEARHEVLEFVAFKKVQVRVRPRWKSEAEGEGDPSAAEETRTTATPARVGRVDRGPWAAPTPGTDEPGRRGEDS